MLSGQTRTNVHYVCPWPTLLESMSFDMNITEPQSGLALVAEAFELDFRHF